MVLDSLNEKYLKHLSSTKTCYFGFWSTMSRRTVDMQNIGNPVNADKRRYYNSKKRKYSTKKKTQKESIS